MTLLLLIVPCSESTSIPTNPRTGRAVGYAFVDLHTKEEAEKAIQQLSGQEVLERKVSVQLARKPGASSPDSTENDAPSGDASEKKGGRGGGRFRGGGGRRGRGGHKVGIVHHTLWESFTNLCCRTVVPVVLKLILRAPQPMSPDKFSP